MKTIGIVAEGPRDFELLSAVVDTITGQENNYYCIQPEQDAAGKFGNGWKGVWQWCECNHGKLNTYMNSLTPKIDLLIIHMDGDVQRREKEVHCDCQRNKCNMPQDTHPLKCKTLIEDKQLCPVRLPCEIHGNYINTKAKFLRNFLNKMLLPEQDLPISYVIPCDATDTWIVAAFDDYTDYEILPDPWERIVAKASTYHGIKIKNRPHKNKRTYWELITIVCNNWNLVVERCSQARKFDEDVRKYILKNN